MTLEMKKNGYEKLDRKIQEIEGHASAGIYTDNDIKSMTLRFQQIAREARSLRQIMREIILMVPEQSSKGDAAITAGTFKETNK
jgi:hypothetical protein